MAIAGGFSGENQWLLILPCYHARHPGGYMYYFRVYYHHV